MVAVGITDAWHACVSKQEVESDRQEGQVSHQREVLSVQNHLVQPVGEREPIQSLTHAVQVGISHSHGQIIIVQPLRGNKQHMNSFHSMTLSNCRSNVVFVQR